MSKTILMVPWASQPITELPSDVRERLGLPQFLHGGLTPQKNVNLTEENPPEVTAKNTPPTLVQSSMAAKIGHNRAGRPKAKIDVKRAFRMQREGFTMRQIQQQLNCSLRSLERALANYKKKRWDF